MDNEQAKEVIDKADGVADSVGNKLRSSQAVGDLGESLVKGLSLLSAKLETWTEEMTARRGSFKCGLDRQALRRRTSDPRIFLSTRDRADGQSRSKSGSRTTSWTRFLVSDNSSRTTWPRTAHPGTMARGGRRRTDPQTPAGGQHTTGSCGQAHLCWSIWGRSPTPVPPFR